jgi:type IV pilus assembly protein PilM
LSRKVSVGLDIGSSAVRAAEVAADGQKSSLTRFGQVGLAAGAVVDGEVRDPGAVAAAVRRLWSEAGFRSRDVALGVSSQRSMVRQVDMPKMSRSEIRAALRYEIGDLLPIPVDQAVFDFVDLGPGRPKGDGGETTQVLLVAAQRDTVLDHMAVVRRAGLKVKAVESSPLALLRAVPALDDGGLQAVVNVGANLVVVAVREGSTPRFLRTAVRVDEAAATARQSAVGAAAGARSAPQHSVLVQHGGAGGLEATVDEVRGSVEYFLGYARDSRLSSVLLTGGGALQEGLSDRLAGALGVPVQRAQVVAQTDPAVLGLAGPQYEEAAARWATAVGLALWGLAAGPSLSLVPAEVQERQRYRRALAATGCGLVVIAGACGYLSHVRVSETRTVAAEVATAQADANGLQARIDRLKSVTAVQSQLVAEKTLVGESLAGDVDWVGLIGRIEAALPLNVRISDIQVQRSNTGSPTGAGAASGPSGNPGQTVIGSVTMQLSTTAGPAAVAEFVRSVWLVPGVRGLWVAQSSTTAGVTTFAATAQVTGLALSNRATRIVGGQP